jgi:hypothetical protein
MKRFTALPSTTRPRRFMRATVLRWALVQRPQPQIAIFAVLNGSRVMFRSPETSSQGIDTLSSGWPEISER